MNNLPEHLEVFPDNSQSLLLSISKDQVFKLKVTKQRHSKLGDFKYPIKNEEPIITLNRDPNKYKVLITFLHELAHLLVWLENGRLKNPHGSKWKRSFANLMDIFLKSDLFPTPLDLAVKNHIVNPRASSHADIALLNALRNFDPPSEKKILLDLATDEIFKLRNGKTFKKGILRRTRILCQEIGSRRKYLIHGHAEVMTVE